MLASTSGGTAIELDDAWSAALTLLVLAMAQCGAPRPPDTPDPRSHDLVGVGLADD